jgi:hypothetical protein
MTTYVEVSQALVTAGYLSEADVETAAAVLACRMRRKFPAAWRAALRCPTPAHRVWLRSTRSMPIRSRLRPGLRWYLAIITLAYS